MREKANKKLKELFDEERERYTKSTEIIGKDKNSDVAQPSERPVLKPQWKGADKHLNHIIGPLIKASRVKQTVQAFMNQLPDEGDTISVDFENEPDAPYEVLEIYNRYDLFDNPDKFRIKCRLAKKRMNKDPSKYPDKIKVGLRTGKFE